MHFMQICLAITPTYRDVPKVFGHCNVLLYISYKTTIFENIIPKSFLFDFDEIFTNRSENVRSFL